MSLVVSVLVCCVYGIAPDIFLKHIKNFKMHPHIYTNTVNKEINKNIKKLNDKRERERERESKQKEEENFKGSLSTFLKF